MPGHKNNSQHDALAPLWPVSGQQDAKDHWFLTEVVRLVETRLNSPLIMAEIAVCTNYSERWLYARFKFLTGYSVAQYIRRRKLTLAAALLRHTRLSLTDISVMYCFSSLQQFSRAFRQQFHCSPSQYREAGVWNMSYTQPVLYRTRDKISCRFFSLSNESPTPYRSVLKKKGINFGGDYINEYQNNTFTYNQNLYQELISTYEKTRHMTHFIMAGELLPGQYSDTELHHRTESVMPSADMTAYLPTGTYFEVLTSGTREEFAKIHMYDCYNMLTINKCLLCRAPMQTFCRQQDGDIFDLRIIYLCANVLLPDTLES